MFTLTQTEVSDLIANIEIGWAKSVPAAFFKNIDNFGEVAQETTFYRFDNRVFGVIYTNRTTVTEYKEVTGEALELFNIFYKEG